MAAPKDRIDTVVFDIGNVLITWDPRWLFRKLLPDDGAIERFMTETDFVGWNVAHDAGQRFADGIARHGEKFPHHRHLFQAFFDRWEETLGGPIADSVALSRELRGAGYRTLALTNFSAETFPRAVRLHPFLSEFEGVVVSGREGLIKPDPAIYHCLCARYQVEPQRAVFIDDSLPNVHAAQAVGMHAIHFTPQTRLRKELEALGVAA